MSRTIIDDVTLDASGGATPSVSARFGKERRQDVALQISSSDASNADFDVDLSGVKVWSDEVNFATPNTSESFTNLDASTDELGLRLTETDGYEMVEITVTNNGAGQVQVTVKAEGY